MEIKIKNNQENQGIKSKWSAHLRLLGLMITGMMVGLMTVMGPYLLMAQGVAKTDAAKTNSSFVAINADCQIAIKPFIDKQQKEFLEFMQQTFSNKSDTSVLIDVAMQRYRNYRTAIINHVNKHVPISGDVSINLSQQLSCQKMAQDALIVAEAALRQHVRNTAQGKKTAKFVQKMQTLNKKLGELQREVGTFKGYMDSFETKLPCYTAQCVK